jgi:pimeloyl-ACP methyl ester carboxylesterase
MSVSFGSATTDVAPQLVDVRGRTTQVLRKGSGRPLVYLHSTTGESWWTELDEDLSRDFDVVHPAHPGFEGSEGLNDIEDITDLAFHTFDLLDALGLDQVSLVGSSSGGWLAAEMAVIEPSRFDAMVIVAPTGLGSPGVDMWAVKPPDLAALLFADQTHWMAQLLKAIDPTELVAPELFLPLLQAMEAGARIGWNPYMADPKLAGRLHRVKARTLVVHGDEDGFMPRPPVERYAELIDGALFVTIPSCGHLPVLERPAELAALVRKHLAG